MSVRRAGEDQASGDGGKSPADAHEPHRPMGGYPMERDCPFDPPPELAVWRAEAPLRRFTFPDGSAGWIVTGYDLAAKVLADARFSANMERIRFPIPWPPRPGMTPGEPTLPGAFAFMDPPEHTRLREPLQRHFSPSRMRALEPRIEQIVEARLDVMAQSGPPIDLRETFALPVPSLVICELLGVPYADRAEFQSQGATLLNAEADAEEATDAAVYLVSYLAELIDRKRSAPSHDLLSDLAIAGELGDDELVGVGMSLLVAGHETTTSMLTLGTYALLEHPQQLRTVQSGVVPIDNVVEELLRYLSLSTIGLQRAALEDVELNGQMIKRGEPVTVAIAAANRDPAFFDHPDELRVERPLDRHHIAFGRGVHQCIGQQLARIELRIAFSALLRRFPSLHLAIPPEEIATQSHFVAYRVDPLPVAW